MNHKRLSFEFFPPKTAQGREKLQHTCAALNVFKPDFFSVTYGAGGSTRDNTQKTVLDLQSMGVTVAPHLSFSHHDQGLVLDLIRCYQRAGIQRIVALRGDTPSGTGMQHPIYAKQLIEFIRQHTGDHFHIEVAAYPEIHPDAPDYDSDVHYLKQKVDAGANSIITQYFFNNDAYFYFVDQCQQAGIGKPIYPGIMPIVNYHNLVRFSNKCGAEIPRWIRKRLESYSSDQASIQSFGAELCYRLCETLLAGGAPGLHFYTMNQIEPTKTVCQHLLRNSLSNPDIS